MGRERERAHTWGVWVCSRSCPRRPRRATLATPFLPLTTFAKGSLHTRLGGEGDSFHPRTAQLLCPHRAARELESPLLQSVLPSDSHFPTSLSPLASSKGFSAPQKPMRRLRLRPAPFGQLFSPPSLFVKVFHFHGHLVLCSRREKK